jgi:hypothetical protein
MPRSTHIHVRTPTLCSSSSGLKVRCGGSAPRGPLSPLGRLRWNHSSVCSSSSSSSSSSSRSHGRHTRDGNRLDEAHAPPALLGLHMWGWGWRGVRGARRGRLTCSSVMMRSTALLRSSILCWCAARCALISRNDVPHTCVAHGMGVSRCVKARWCISEGIFSTYNLHTRRKPNKAPAAWSIAC